MEGLDATEASFSGLNQHLRFDSDYFKNAYLSAENLLSHIPVVQLGSVAIVADGDHSEFPTDQKDEVPYLKARDVRGFFIEVAEPTFVSNEYFLKNLRSKIEANNILFSIMGTVGGLTITPQNFQPCMANRALAIIRDITINPSFCFSFLLTRYASSQIERQTTGGVQQRINLQALETILVPRFSEHLESAVETIVGQAHEQRACGLACLAVAEETLLRALGLEDWEPPEPLTYTRRASEALAAARFDAEYFAPRVEQLLAKLSCDGLTIHDVAPARHEAFDASNFRADSFSYIEISGLRSDGTATSESTPTAEAPSRASQKVHADDIITSTVRPIRRLSAIVAPEQDEHVCSSGFVVLNPTAIAPEVLLTYLRLPVVCELLDLHTSASLYPAISERDILKFPIPKIAVKVAKEIITQVRQAHLARQEAHELLARAKRAVEIAIEQGEAAGMKYIAE